MAVLDQRMNSENRDDEIEDLKRIICDPIFVVDPLKKVSGEVKMMVINGLRGKILFKVISRISGTSLLQCYFKPVKNNIWIFDPYTQNDL